MGASSTALWHDSAVNSESIESLFEVPVHAVVRPIPAEELPLEPEEGAVISRAVPKRRIEFSTGRWCARQALLGLGAPAGPLLRGEDGAVLWPPGVVGSVSHSRRWCAAVVTRSADALGVGLDVEESGRLSEAASKLVLSPVERQAVLDHELGPGVCRTVMFSAKEAIYKALRALVSRYIDFSEAEITVGDQGALGLSLDEALERQLPASARLVGRYRLLGDSIVTAVTVTSR